MENERTYDIDELESIQQAILDYLAKNKHPVYNEDLR